MFKLLEKVGGGPKRDPTSLVGKTVQVGKLTVVVDSQLGEGGFARIYHCRDVASQQVYALKHIRIPPGSDMVASFQHEARIMARLKGHPNILSLHAVSFAGPKGAETGAPSVPRWVAQTGCCLAEASNSSSLSMSVDQLKRSC